MCNFTYLAVGGDVKSVSQLQTGCAANRHLWCIEGPVRFLNLGPTTERYATAVRFKMQKK